MERALEENISSNYFQLLMKKDSLFLYSTSDSRPNILAKVIVGALIIKELFDYSDNKL